LEKSFFEKKLKEEWEQKRAITPFPLKWENSKSQILQNGSNRCTISCYLAGFELNLVECILI
jgi:hypothetical protein